MKKILFLAIFLTTPVWAADYYFSNSTGGNITVLGNNANPCSLAAPCNDFRGTTLDNANALSPGDTIWLDAGDDWVGSTAEIRIISNGTSGSPITLSGYGAGKATLQGMTNYPSGWTSCNAASTPACPASGVYYMTGITFTNSFVNNAGYGTTVSNYRGLGKWGEGYSSNSLSNLQPGSFWFDSAADRVYIYRWDGANPNTAGDMLLPTFVTGPSSNNLRGLICTGCENPTYGNYITIDMENLEIIGAPGMGITFGGHHNKLVDASNIVNFESLDSMTPNIVGCGKDCIYAYYNQIAGEEASYFTMEGIRVKFGAASGTNHGQAITSMAPYTLFYNCQADHNFMYGFDALKGTNAQADSSFGAAKYVIAHDNGLWPDSRGFDSNFYCDGCHDWVIKDFMFYNVGGGNVFSTSTGATNDRASSVAGAELPSSYPVYNVHFVNGVIHNSNWMGIATQNIPGTVDNITGIKLINSTIIARRSGSEGNHVKAWSDMAAGTNLVEEKNNIFYAESGGYVDAFASGMTTVLDADYNLFYVEGGSSNIYRTGGVNYTLATWRTLTGEDANSLNSDPKFITDTQGSFDLHLWHTATGQASTSPAVNAGVEAPWACPAHLYANWPTYFPECAPGANTITGSTRTDDVADDVATSMDIGFHFPTPAPSGPGTLTSTNVEPATLVTSAVGTTTITFTADHAWPLNGKLVVVMPSNLGSFTFSSGGASVATCTVGCDGSLAVGVSSNTLTLTRSGGTQTSASTAITITVTKVQNPNDTGVLDNYSMSTTDSDGSVLDSNSSVSGDTLTAPSSSGGGTGAVVFNAICNCQMVGT